MLYAVNVLAKTDDVYISEANLALDDKNFEQAENILIRHIEHAPKDTEARFLLARVFSWQQKWAEAFEQFDKLLKEKPDNADLLLARANTLEWMGLRKQALYELEKARELSPDYSEVWRTEIIILQREDTPRSRAKALTLYNSAKQTFPEKDWDQLLVTEKNVVSESDSYATEFAYGHDQLTNNRSPWSITSIKLSRQTHDRHYSHVQLDSVERFDLEDWQFGASYAFPAWQSWNFYLAATYSPTHNVLANRMLDTNLSKSFEKGVVLHAGLSHARYTETSSQQLHLGGEYYWSEFRVSYTFRLIDVLNAGTGENHNIQFNHYYSPADMTGISIAGGEDVEFNGTSSPPVSDVLSLSLYGYHMFKPQWTLLYSLIYHQQGSFYNRNGFVLGIKFDF